VKKLGVASFSYPPTATLECVEGRINDWFTSQQKMKTSIENIVSIVRVPHAVEVWYEYLEQEFAKWKKTTKCDTQGEEILVRELCHKQNEIRKARALDKSVDSLVKSLQEIMKNSALTPALQNAASAGKSAEAFGVWIKDIETMSPAEWWEDQEKYEDMDDMQQDIKDIKSSIGTFITGSRDYNTTDLEEINESDFENSDLGG